MNQRLIREQIMAKLAKICNQNGGFVSRKELEAFTIDGVQRKLVDQSRGIRNPNWLDSTLSIISNPDGPYEDVITDDGFLEYAYQSGSTEGVNTKLRVAMRNQDPIILFRKISPGIYTAHFPVFVVGDDPVNKKVLVALDDSLALLGEQGAHSPLQKTYVERIVKQRLHQPEFRGRVIRAYNTKCAVCSLAHGELLDAAHIIPDSNALGTADVTNGLSLCKIHHSAFDQYFLGINPDYEVVINGDLLAEVDGPMLKHGIQEMHGRMIILPDAKSQWPNRENLEQKFSLFMAS